MSDFLQSVDWLKKKGIDQVDLGIVLGTGLHGLVDRIEIIKEFNYSVIPNFPIATVEFHFGKLIYGMLEGKKVVVCVGRFHYYEGHSMDEVVLPVRVMKFLGAKAVLLSNAAGGLNPAYKAGDLMLLDDHINLQVDNPLIGQNDDNLGDRFPDMSEPYSNKLNAIVQSIAEEKGITLHKGVYAAVPGPALETRAEYRYLRTIGADAVGMSTVPEVIACNHMGLPCVCLSVITDECNPDNLRKVSVEQIVEVAKNNESKLTDLFCGLIKQF
jgi:purine-nucleoside phosphorylase